MDWKKVKGNILSALVGAAIGTSAATYLHDTPRFRQAPTAVEPPQTTYKFNEETPAAKPSLDDIIGPVKYPTRLVSDSFFENATYMNPAQVQQFLERKNSVLAKEHNGVLPSKMISDAAQEYKINPIVLLATLQKENGLVQAQAATQKQLDWAFGAGATDSGRISSYSGLQKQVLGAARILRRWHDAQPTELTVNYGTEKLAPENKATFALYKYTPHTTDTKLTRLGGGNWLFLNILRKYVSEHEKINVLTDK